MKHPMYYAMNILLHPIDTINELCAYRKKAISYSCSFLVLALWIIVTILKFEWTGFLYNPDYFIGVSIYNVLVQTVVVFILWVGVNWALCAIVYGDATFKEIWVISSYALIPYIVLTFFNILCSNVLIQGEVFFMTWIRVIALGWSISVLTYGLKIFHNYSLGTTIKSMLLTIVGMFIVVFLGILAFSLVQQIYFTVKTIFFEIILRV